MKLLLTLGSLIAGLGIGLSIQPPEGPEHATSMYILVSDCGIVDVVVSTNRGRSVVVNREQDHYKLERLGIESLSNEDVSIRQIPCPVQRNQGVEA